MRKPRIIIFEDYFSVRNFLTDMFTQCGYEVQAFAEPVTCPAYDDGVRCADLPRCADLILSDFNMPKMNGLQMLEKQLERGCRVPARNRAIASGNLDDATIARIQSLGARFFQKPFDFSELHAWVAECESRMDLSQPLATKRRNSRSRCTEEVLFALPSGHQSLKGTCLNMSPTGMCVSFGTPVAQGLTLTVYPASLHARVATVRWVKGVESNAYLAGLQFA